MLLKLNIKSFLLLFLLCLFLEIGTEEISVRLTLPWVSLVYNIIFCVFAFILIRPYNRPESLSVTEKERRLIASRRHKVIALIFIFAWFGLFFWIISVLDMPAVNAWYMIVPALPAAFGEELLYKGILFKYLHQVRRWNFWLSAIQVSMVFALYHRQFNLTFVKHIIWSLYSFLIYYHCRSLILVGLFHYFHNLTFYFWIP